MKGSEAMGPAGAKHFLVVANETVGGEKLLEAIRRRTREGRIRCTVICPQTKPRKGFVVSDESVRSAAHIRLDLMLERLRQMKIEARGEVMDPNPFRAVTDALRTYGADEIIISTHPYPRSGWLRRDLVQRIADHSKLPVEHVMVDLGDEPVKHVLVVANRTVGGRPLIEALQRRAAEGPHRFTIVCPIGGADAATERAAESRLLKTLDRLKEAGLDAVGQVMEPDPLTSIVSAMHYHPAEEVVISTLPAAESDWLRCDLVNMARASVGRPVEHVVVDPSAEQADAEVEAG